MNWTLPSISNNLHFRWLLSDFEGQSCFEATKATCCWKIKKMEVDNDVIMSQTKHNSVVDMKHWWAAETLNGLLWGISSKPLTTPLARMAARHRVPNWLQPLVQTAHCGWLLHKYGSPPSRRAAGDGRNICRSRRRDALCQRPWLTMPQHFRCCVGSEADSHVTEVVLLWDASHEILWGDAWMSHFCCAPL